MHRAVPVVLLAALIALAGCGMLGDSQPPSDDRALAVRNETVDALADVTSYRASIDGDVSASAEGRSRTISITGYSVVNRTIRKMRMNTTVEGRTSTGYLDGRKVYTECSSPWSGWEVKNQSKSAEWLTLTPLGRQVELFERTNVYWGGNATIDGRKTSVLVAYPSKKTVSSLPGQGQTGLANTDATVENITAKLWVDQETSRPVRSLLEVQISGSGGEATATVTIEYTDYNEPAPITMPELSTDEIREVGCPG